ncbi:MAG: hypothetical protein SOZ49_09220 [Clostridiaceae bacterium]|nr:hypothetical protein [Clostridiaceae bacterium]
MIETVDIQLVLTGRDAESGTRGRAFAQACAENVYGRTREEAEAKLADLIMQIKAETAALRSGRATEYPGGVSPKKKQFAAYLVENPSVSNKCIHKSS